MRTCFSIDPLTLDPRKSGDPITSVFLSMLYDGLTRTNPDGSTELALAQDVRVSEDSRVYEFTLRETFWSNGDPICAKDVEASWKRSLDPQFASPFRHLFFIFQNGERAAQGECSLNEVGITAVNSRTLKVELESSCPHFLALISLCAFLPVPSSFETKLSVDATSLAVSGAFRIASWQKREVIRLIKNPLYWDKKNVTLDEFVIYICSNPYVNLQMFDEGDVDFLSNILSAVPPGAVQRYTEQGLTRFIPTGGTTFCSFNTTTFPFHNQHIRKAFSLAINREELVRDAGCFDMPATQLLPPPLSKTSVPCVYDPELAVHHLNLGMQELGVISDKATDQLKVRLFFENLRLCFEDSPVKAKIALALQKQWKQSLKLQIKLEGAAYQSHLQKLYAGSYSIAISSWLAQYMDPLDVLERFVSKKLAKNYPRFEDAAYAEAVEQAKKTIDRSKWIRKAEEILIEQAPISPLYHYDHMLIARPQVTGISHLPNAGLRFSNGRLTSGMALHETFVDTR